MKKEMNFLDKEILLLDAIRAMIEKLGIQQAAQALVAAIALDDFRYFTNGNEYTINFRDVLKTNFVYSDARIIISKLSKNNIPEDINYNELIDICVKFVIKDMKKDTYYIPIMDNDYYFDEEDEDTIDVSKSIEKQKTL